MNYGKLTIGVILIVLGTLLALFDAFLMIYVLTDGYSSTTLQSELFGPGTSMQIFLVLATGFLIGGYKLANSAKPKESVATV